MKALRIATIATLALAALAPASLADGRNPGSVLIFPFLRHSISIVSVTNTYYQGTAPGQFAGSTRLHYEYMHVVEGSDPFNPDGCRLTNTIEYLTPADTLSVLTRCHAGLFPEERGGYLVVSAQDPSVAATPWSFDYLIGRAFVADALGYVQVVNAIPFNSPLAHGKPTDINGNGRLDFDGVEYEGVADTMYADSVLPCGPPSRLNLVNLTGGPNECNTIYLSIWNDNEVPLSATRKFRCWFDQPLEIVTPLFLFHFLNRLPSDPEEMDWDCDGVEDINTGWFCIDSIDVSTSGGLPYARDGAVVGTISPFYGTHLLWESYDRQYNGVAFTP